MRLPIWASTWVFEEVLMLTRRSREGSGGSGMFGGGPGLERDAEIRFGMRELSIARPLDIPLGLISAHRTGNKGRIVEETYRLFFLDLSCGLRDLRIVGDVKGTANKSEALTKEISLTELKSLSSLVEMSKGVLDILLGSKDDVEEPCEGVPKEVGR